jgi:predicted PurR-regulated permease PerM
MVQHATIQTPMLKLKRSLDAANALVGIWTVSLTAFIFATLYLARDLLVPLTLAALLTFLLAPLVTRLERWLGRIGAVLLVVTVILAATGAGGWVLTRQLVDLAIKLPDYKENIQTKLRSFKVPTGGRFTKFSVLVEELKKDLPGAKARDITRTWVPGQPQTAVVTEPSTKPVQVQVIETSTANPFDLVQVIIAPLLGPLGQAALVLLLVIFMLLKREDLRSRLIRLIGQGHISATTRAMDDAGARVTRYLLMQLVVNVTYGVSVAIGLYFIGVPNAVLWGASAAVLRFIPYVGPWIGAAIPIALSLAVSPGWIMPLLTLGLFVVLELLSNNVMEPWLYGSSTGVSPIALIFGAVCWTWLWGPVGLVLATPMTVCLVVMGRHIPRLSFLSVVLSDEEALTPAEDCYYRLLTVGEQDELELVEAYLKANSLSALYDSVFIPVITAVEIDHRLELLDDKQRALLEQSLRDIIEDLGARPPVRSRIDAEKGVAADAAAVASAPGCASLRKFKRSNARPAGGFCRESFPSRKRIPFGWPACRSSASSIAWTCTRRPAGGGFSTTRPSRGESRPRRCTSTRRPENSSSGRPFTRERPLIGPTCNFLSTALSPSFSGQKTRSRPPWGTFFCRSGSRKAASTSWSWIRTFIPRLGRVRPRWLIESAGESFGHPAPWSTMITSASFSVKIRPRSSARLPKIF